MFILFLLCPDFSPPEKEKEQKELDQMINGLHSVLTSSRPNEPGHYVTELDAYLRSLGLYVWEKLWFCWT